MKNIDRERLLETLHYDPNNGIFSWKKNRIRKLVGATTGEPKANGYIEIRVFGCKVLAHRLAWLYLYGAFPDHQLDHINGNPADNRIANLRECVHFENHQNMRRQANNTSGYIGVNWHKLRGKWRAHLTHMGKHIHLGLFDNAEEAYGAYCKAKAEYHKFQPTHR